MVRSDIRSSVVRILTLCLRRATTVGAITKRRYAWTVDRRPKPAGVHLVTILKVVIVVVWGIGGRRPRRRRRHMSHFTHVQIAQFRRLYDSYRSKSSGISDADLVLILVRASAPFVGRPGSPGRAVADDDERQRHLGPDLPLVSARQMIRQFGLDADFVKFDDLVRLLAAYETDLQAARGDLARALQYFVKVIQRRRSSLSFGRASA